MIWMGKAEGEKVVTEMKKRDTTISLRFLQIICVFAIRPALKMLVTIPPGRKLIILIS